MNSYKPVSRLTIKFVQIGKPVMLYHEHKEVSSPLYQAPARVHTPAPWTYPGLDTALGNEDQLPIKKRNATGTITCICIVVPPVIGLPNAPTRDQGESPPLPLPPPLKEVCLFLLLCLFCLLPPLLLPKSSITQKTKLHCS